MSCPLPLLSSPRCIHGLRHAWILHELFLVLSSCHNTSNGQDINVGFYVRIFSLSHRCGSKWSSNSSRVREQYHTTCEKCGWRRKGDWLGWNNWYVWHRNLEKGMATHSRILAWRIPWTEEPGRLQFMGSQEWGHDRAIYTHTGMAS